MYDMPVRIRNKLSLRGFFVLAVVLLYIDIHKYRGNITSKDVILSLLQHYKKC